jgi:hypothetical protein
VTSDLLFAMDPETGKPVWQYQGGALLNSTSTLGDGMIFFLESRNPEAISAPFARQSPNVLTDQWLVALDLKTGKKLWQKTHDFSALKFMTYLVHGKNTVVVTGTDASKNFHTFAFNAPSPRGNQNTGDDIIGAIGGRLLWSESHKEDKGHHSGHLQHPVGMTVHDPGAIWGQPFRQGQVFTVDPMMWIPDEKLYVRMEDTILVTTDGIENFTAFLASTPDEIEAVMKQEGMLSRVPRLP